MPASIAARIARGIRTTRGRPVKVNPTQAAANAPMYSWPSAPILKTPQRAETENASAVKISGVAQRSDRATL